MKNNNYFTIALAILFVFWNIHAFSQVKMPFEAIRVTSNVAVTPTPTITLLDVTNPTLNTVQGIPVSQTINVSGVNLSVNLGLAITGADAGLFSLSQYVVSETAGTIPNTIVTITYTPVVPGSNSATLIMSSPGAMAVARTLNGNTSVATGLQPLVSTLIVSAENGNVLIRAKVGETLEIYNAIGQKLIETLTVEGINLIPVKARGVLLVKLGNRIAKVIL
jgi:hypothetical protein